MKTIKEKPKGGKSRGKGRMTSQPALTQRQAAKLLKDKYIQQLDQRQPESVSAEAQAVDQVEGGGMFVVDELAVHTQPHRSRQRDSHIKEKPQPEQETAGQTPGPDSPPPPEGPSTAQGRPTTAQGRPTAATPKERAVQIKTRQAEAASGGKMPPRTADQPPQAVQTIKERPANTIKSGKGQPQAPIIKERGAYRPAPPPATARQAGPDPSRQRIERPGQRRPTAPQGRGRERPVSSNSPTRPMQAVQRRGLSRQPGSSAGRAAQSTQAVQTTKTVPGAGRQLPRGRASPKAPVPKCRGIAYAKAPFAPKTARTPFKASPRPLRAAGQTAQRRMTQQAIKQAGSASPKTVSTAKKVVQAVAKKTAASLVSSLIGLVGGGILLIVLVVVIMIAAVANSPFGLFFAEERSAPDAVSVAEAVGTVNAAYNTKLEELQAGDYDSIDVTGAAADWPDVLAVFAARYAGAEDGVDVATLDADRVSKLTATFWDMTALTSTVETIDHPDSDPDDDTDDSWTERILHLTITAKTAEDMKTAYGFTAYQVSALDELLADRAALSSLAGSLAITNADVREVLAALPADLEQARRDTVQTALQLVGKVNYFWGGKSRAIGWDSRWGQLTKVWAAGSSTTGTYRPFGLDCSGFVDWTFNNSLGYIIGHGGGVIMQHRYCTDISQNAAQPGDLAFYPDDSHIGIIVGRNEAGKLLVCHCASGQNNVVITEFSVSGFTDVGRPDIFSP